jgi:hypothetical protein
MSYVIFVYQSQKVLLFRPSLSFLTEAQPRHFLAEVRIKFFRRPHELQSKRSLEKLQTYFVSTFLK